MLDLRLRFRGKRMGASKNSPDLALKQPGKTIYFLIDELLQKP
jgi:hypothetical protein